MIGHRPFGWDDYVDIWRRRKAFIIGPALIGPLLLFGVSLVLPNRFESDTLVLIQSQRIPNNMVQSIITEDLNARVASLEEQVLSRTRLEGIIKHYDLFKQNNGQETMEQAVDDLRKDIVLTPVKPIVRSRDQTLPGFSIGVTLPTAQLAQQVCAEITSMFIEENLRQREQSGRGTTNFFQAQIDDAKRQIDDQDSKLAEFKTKHMHELPEETQANLNLLTSMNSQLEAATQAVNRAQQDKTYTESLLAQQVAAWKAAQVAAGGDGTQPQTLQQELTNMQSQLAMLEVQDTPEHPDIIRLKDEIEKLKKKIHDQAPAPGTKPEAPTQHASAVEPPQIQQMRSQLRAYEEAIRAYSEQQRRVQAQIELLQSRVQLSPLVEQQYKELTRDHETAQNFYNDLLKKRNESQMATDLEQRQQGEQFLIMDPANMPKDPVFPNRPLFALGGLLGGLFMGLALAWIVEAGDKALRNDKDIEACLGLPTLAMVPSLTTSPKERRFKLGEAGRIGTSEGRAAGN